MSRSKKLAVVVVGAVAALAIGSFAVAAVPDAGVVHACYKKDTGALRVYDNATNQPKACTDKEAPLDWSQQGPKGDPGVSDGYITRPSPVVAAYQTTAASLFLPPGSYVISAKLEAYSPAFANVAFNCVLGAGTNLQNNDVGAGVTGAIGMPRDLTLTIAHTFNYGASAVLNCSGGVVIENAVLTAVKVGELHTS